MTLHTSHGDIIVIEKRFLRSKRVLRPLSLRCSLTNRIYTRRLQRLLVDFGSDVSFNLVSQKMHEHHGFNVSTESVRIITHKHAAIMQHGTLKNQSNKENHEYLIAQADGVMVPTVSFKQDPEENDKRKNRVYEWKEMRVGMIYPKGDLHSHYAVSMTTPNDLGDQMLECARQIGLNEKTKVHFVGDGAPWIAEQADRIFGSQSTFLIDFYHLAGYLSDAARCVSPEDPEGWFQSSKQLAKQSRIEEILQDLNAHIASNHHTPCAALTAYNYIIKRLNLLDYKTAQAKKLPIGSGRIESTNKSLVQARLKRAGAWWLSKNALAMINLRIVRARQLWDVYWQTCQA